MDNGSKIGVCYGMLGDDLPHPQEVIDLYKRNNISRMRIYEPNDATLRALCGSNIELMIGVRNQDIKNIACSDGNDAKNWVKTNIVDHSGVKFRYIAVGNEINTSHDESRYLVRAMQNLQKAVDSADLDIKVSTSLKFEFFENTYPPSHGEIMSRYRHFLDPIIQFLKDHHAPLLLNIYPYFAYEENTKDISLDYALLRGNSGFYDHNGLRYSYLFDAMLDAAYSALEKVGGSCVEIVVSETGWPSYGGTGTTRENASAYNNNLMKHVKNGTPKTPGKTIETYLFAMFDEHKKHGAVTERHWGLFSPNKDRKYGMDW